MRKVFVVFLLFECLGLSVSFCVFENKKGWWLDCGIRDSYLFRIKDLGGIQANFDVGIGFGDEKGFPNSISKTNHKGKGSSKYLPPSTYLPAYGSSNSGYRRKNDNVIQHRRSDFPYKFESPPTQKISFPSSGGENRIAAKQYYNQQPNEPPTPKQEVQYIHHQRGPPNPKYNDQIKLQQPPLKSQNQYHQYYNQIASQSTNSVKQKNPPLWRLKKPQMIATRRSQAQPQNRVSKYSFIPPTPTKKFQARTYDENSAPSYNPPGLLLPPPPQFPQQPPSYYNHYSRQDNGFFNPGFRKPFVFQVPTTTTQPPPTVGPAMSELLNVPSHLSANSDNVPSFAAKMFVVREAPYEYYPPKYEGGYNPHRPKINVQIPRTKFYCEEQKYLPGIYADAMLGCKVFHLCVPSSVGSTLTSYMCPNGTLFDQSILQCNYWYNVDCESSVNDYDANLALALSYRRINAAHMPLQSATNTETLSLLSQNIDHLQVANPKNSVSKRMGKLLDEVNINTKTTSKSDDKVLLFGINKYINNTQIDQNITNSDNIVNSTAESKISLTSNSLNYEKVDISQDNTQNSLKNLIVNVQNLAKEKKSSELDMILAFNSDNTIYQEESQNPSSWTPILI